MKTAAEIYEAMCTQYADLTGQTVKDGCDMAVRLYAAAAEIESIYIYNDWVMRQAFPQTAEGEYLELHAQMRGLKRREAEVAYGLITFEASSPPDTALEIPIGTVCLNAAGERFITLQPGRIAAGQRTAEIPAKAVEKGTGGNAPARTIVYMQQPPTGVVACVNEEEFHSGRDREEDDALRERILNNYSGLSNGANASYYEKLALSIGGVYAAKAIPKCRGAGTVDVIITSKDGMPSQNLINNVQDIMDAAREICVDVLVRAPEPVTVDVTLKIDFDEADGYSRAAITVNRDIERLFDGSLLGCDMLVAKLANTIYTSEMIKNYKLTAPTDDIEIGETQLPVLGEVSITQMNWT